MLKKLYNNILGRGLAVFLSHFACQQNNSDETRDLEELTQDGSNFCEESGYTQSNAPFKFGNNTTASWIDKTAEVGLSSIEANGVSLLDANNDNFPDIFVVFSQNNPKRAELFINCNEGIEGRFIPMDLETRTEGVESLIQGTAAYSTDLDGDGLVDLLTAGYGGTTQVLFNQGYLRYELRTVANETLIRDAIATNVAAMDLDIDSKLDLYISNQSTAGGNTKENRGQGPKNSVLLQRERRIFEDVTDKLTDILDGGREQTFAVGHISRHSFGLDDLLFIGNDFSDDFMYPHVGLSFSKTIVFPYYVPTMGIDYTYLDNSNGEFILVRSNWGSPIVFQVTQENELIDFSSRRGVDLSTEYIGWSVQFVEGNNSGNNGFVVANQSAYHNSIGDGLLEYYLRNRDDSYTRTDPSASFDFIKITSTDFLGTYSFDYDRDGCEDLVATGSQFFGKYMRFKSRIPDLEIPIAPLYVFRNNCEYPGNWVGLDMPDDIGAIVELKLTYSKGDTTHKYREIKASTGISGRKAGNQVLFGLGDIASDSTIEAEIHWNDSTTSKYDVKLNTYNEVIR